MRLKRLFQLGACATLALGAIACDDEEGLPDVTIPEDELDEWEVFSFAELVPPYDTEAECVTYLEDELGDTSSLSECRCNNCLEVMQECDALDGCVEIRECAQESGCDNEYNCYLLPTTASCTEVIDRWGNASVATATSIELLDCSEAAGCR